MVVGAVVGIGIFKTPSVVAANVTSEVAFLGLWLLGGVVTLVGALCYAELGSTYPHFGGEYHFLRRAYGPGLGFLFAWGRMAVMQSGSIAAVAFVYGDYASFLFPVGASGSAVHAALAVISLSALQLMGTELSTRAQVALTIASVAVVLVVSVIGLAIAYLRRRRLRRSTDLLGAQWCLSFSLMAVGARPPTFRARFAMQGGISPARYSSAPRQ